MTHQIMQYYIVACDFLIGFTFHVLFFTLKFIGTLNVFVMLWQAEIINRSDRIVKSQTSKWTLKTNAVMSVSVYHI